MGHRASTLDLIKNRSQLEVDGEIDNRGHWEIFDDFNRQAVAGTEADGPWILNSGTDAQAVDPAINVQEGGALRLVTGNADGTTAADASHVACAIPVQADTGGLVFETRIKCVTNIATMSISAGLTDVTGLEEPFTIATTTVTSTASDAVCFTYDTAATTDQWFCLAVDGDTDDTGNGASGVAPSTTYQVLRFEVSSDGATIKFYIDGTLVKTMSGAAGVSPDANLYATVIANATTTTSKTVDVDYIYVGTDR